MDREQIIAKIKKCMALSASANEHEAAAALRQAQKLMAAYDVDQLEIDDSAIINNHVDHPEYNYSKRKPVVIAVVARLMTKAFGVIFVWEYAADDKHRIRYFGSVSGVTLATYSHAVVYRAARAAWRKYIRENPHAKGIKNMRASFVKGWCAAVADKVSALSPDPEQEERMERAKARVYGGELTKATQRETTIPSAFAAGAARGKDFSINKPIGDAR